MTATGDARLAIRTILVSTRAAVVAHLRTGREDLGRESAHRGLVLLGDLRAAAHDAGVEADYDNAEVAITKMADAPLVAIPVEDGDGSHPSRTDPRSPAAPCEAG
jgi:hypothetical protein